MLQVRKLVVLFFVIAAPLGLIVVNFAWRFDGALTPEQLTLLQLLVIPMVLCTLLLLLGPWVVARRDSRRRVALVAGLSVLYVVLTFGAAALSPLIVGALKGSTKFTSETSSELLLWTNILTYIGLAAYLGVIALACHSAIRLHSNKAVFIGVACALIGAVLFVIGAVTWPLWTLAMLLHAAGWTTILFTLYKHESADHIT